ncbi:hypothetical protein DFH27DRAFT_561859 [Peziza echinospora]|nr:hypothetical protein DFH27DRAFT_561859 [Peziza echinospora]
MQLFTTLLLSTGLLLGAASASNINSAPKSGGLHLRSTSTFISPMSPQSLFRRELDAVDEQGKFDSECIKTHKCDEMSAKYYSECYTREKADADDDDDDSEVEKNQKLSLAVGKCICGSKSVAKLLRACAACYEKPKPLLDDWQKTCSTFGVKVSTSSANGLAVNGMWSCAAAAVAAAAVGAM